MSPDACSVWADVSTIVACVVTTFSVGIGAYQFIVTQRSSREAQAVELFIKFNQLNIEQGLASNKMSDHWYNNSKFAITESLYLIAYKSAVWENTVKWMLDQQDEFIQGGNFAVDSYSKRFRAFCKKKSYELKPEVRATQ